jgi:hypothetical protein
MSLFNKMLFDATKGASGFDSTVKVPPPSPTSTQPASVELLTEPDYTSFPVDDYSIPTQPAAAQPAEGVMAVDTTNTPTPEEAAALAAFTGYSNSYAVPSEAYPTDDGSNQNVERNPDNIGSPPDNVPVPTGPDVPYEDVNPYPSPIDVGIPTGVPVGMSDPNTPQGGFLNNGPFVNPYVVATDYGLKGLQPDRTGQNPFARPGPNTVSMQANETIVGPKDDLSQRYFAPQGAKYAEGGEVKDPGYFNKTADENYDIKDYLLDTIPKGISKALLYLNPNEGLDRQVGEELAGYVDTRMENYRARELQERLDRLYEGMTPEEIEAYKIAFIKNVGSSAP